MIKNLQKLNLKLPEVSTPGGSYSSVNIRGNIAYIAIQFPIENGELKYQALNVLAQVHQKIGLENIVGLNHFDAYYQAGENWNDAPKVVDGASDLFVKVLEEKGTHSRAIFGVEKLYGNLCVGLTCTFTLK